MELTILEVLYIVLTVFIWIVWTLTTIALLKLIKILNVFVEIAWFYNKIKQIFVAYGKIPEIVKEKVKETFWEKK